MSYKVRDLFEIFRRTFLRVSYKVRETGTNLIVYSSRPMTSLGNIYVVTTKGSHVAWYKKDLACYFCAVMLRLYFLQSAGTTLGFCVEGNCISFNSCWKVHHRIVFPNNLSLMWLFNLGDRVVPLVSTSPSIFPSQFSV